MAAALGGNLHRRVVGFACAPVAVALLAWAEGVLLSLLAQYLKDFPL